MNDKLTIMETPSDVQTFGVEHPEAKQVEGAVALAYDPGTGKWLGLRMRATDIVWLVGGGRDGTEEFFDTAKRELQEETGYVEFERAFQLGAAVKSFYYNDVKRVYRKSFAYSFLFILDSSKRGDAAQESHEDFDTIWLAYMELYDEIKQTSGGVEHWLDALDRAKRVVENEL